MSDQLLEELPSLADPVDYPMYQVSSFDGISSELKSYIGKERWLVAIVYNDGAAAVKTSIVEVRDGLDVAFAAPANTREMQALLAAPDAVCFAQGESNVQFPVKNLALDVVNGQPVLRSLIPKQILKMPRRDFFRVVLPIAYPLKCQVPVTKDGHKILVTVDVVDISGGGLSFAVPRGQQFINDQDYPGCVIDLRGVGQVTLTLHVCSQFTVKRSTGKQLRAGCRYTRITPMALAQIERFVMQTELEKKARESGMADSYVRANTSTQPYVPVKRRDDRSWDKTRM